MSGWIKLHRTLQDWEWYHNSEMVHLFIHLLLSANIEDNGWRGVTIKRGQLVTSRDKLSAKTGISVQSVRTCLDRLKSTNEIATKSTNKFTIITINNYDNYQSVIPLTNHQINQQLTNNQPATNQQLTTIKEYKNTRIKKERRINTGEISFADYVAMTQSEYDKLIYRYGLDHTKAIIEILNAYKQRTNKVYKSDYLAMFNCVSVTEYLKTLIK